VPAAAAQRLAESLPNAVVQLEILTGVGHSVFRQAPEASFTILRAFLQQLAYLKP
jgi:pimeloyl-ACP methyl ester carboxylesterase